jgi:hypothetical protein
MATKVKAANGWTDYALLTPTKGGKPWKVQINAEGRFRCSCPAFIFCKGAERSCKHCRRCQEERAKEVAQSKAGTWPMGAQQVAPPKPVNRYLDEATKATNAMLTAARQFVNETQRAAMVDTLAARLRAWGGGPMATDVAPMEVVAAQAVVVGVRMITFEDD